mmetsp:Transcript_6093/g.11171  ORF Transcript_6093/g.11171 Transcript_6093/m.11171 type:complete len:81 (-) Transcript_6093:13-255(-)
MSMCSRTDSTPASTGEMNQEATIFINPGHSHLMHRTCVATIVIPRTAPTMVCVVETGKPKSVAAIRKSEPDARAQTMPRS